MSQKDEWTTRIDPALTRPYGVEQIHDVYFEPTGWPGKGPVVSLGIPECELMLAYGDEPAVIVNRPQRNLNVKYWTRFACEKAIKSRALLILGCDTAEQAAIAAKRAARLLPHHRRAALERVLGDPAFRARENLS
jgi:hypothetical protein